LQSYSAIAFLTTFCKAEGYRMAKFFLESKYPSGQNPTGTTGYFAIPRLKSSDLGYGISNLDLEIMRV